MTLFIETEKLRPTPQWAFSSGTQPSRMGGEVHALHQDLDFSVFLTYRENRMPI